MGESKWEVKKKTEKTEKTEFRFFVLESGNGSKDSCVKNMDRVITHDCRIRVYVH